ncbi:MAG: hypothetical protein IPH37_01245 [Burkholderiales bacterium]|nr:hypothetical protein [Burkholderiales bacterium]
MQNHAGLARLLGGISMTGGFSWASRDFYERLRSMPAQELAKIDMTRIDFINQLYGQEDLKRAQRRNALREHHHGGYPCWGCSQRCAGIRQVVSGVGGQYNFVAMAHAPCPMRLTAMLRATHDNKDGLRSSIVWNYGHVTIPRHLRDIIITEYGVADLRGQPDAEVIKRLINVADSRFQDELVKQAKAHGKLELPGTRALPQQPARCIGRKTAPGPRPDCCLTSRLAPTSPTTNCTSCAP